MNRIVREQFQLSNIIDWFCQISLFRFTSTVSLVVFSGYGVNSMLVIVLLTVFIPLSGRESLILLRRGSEGWLMGSFLSIQIVPLLICLRLPREMCSFWLTIIIVTT